MSLTTVLAAGFRLTHDRVQLVFLDLSWKAAWLIATALLLWTAGLWFGSSVEITEVDRELLENENRWLALVAMGRLWNTHGQDLIGVLALAALASVLLWFVMEAYFRAGILSEPWGSFRSRAASNFVPFLLSGVARSAWLMATVTLLGFIAGFEYLRTPLAEWPALWPHARGAILVAGLISLLVALALAILDTLIRTDAVFLLGQELFLSISVLGVLIAIESFVGGSLAVAAAAIVARMSNAADLLPLLVFMTLSAFLLNVLHSYLLLVRYASIGIMRRHAGA